MASVEVWVDGSCRGNPGPGGWAAILVYGDREKELSGGEPHATNQQMELRAAQEGLRAIRTDRRREVAIYTDSEYVRWAFEGNMRKVPKVNRRLLAELLEAAERHDVRCEKVKGHQGVKYNVRAHELAMRKSAEMELRSSLEG